MDAFHFACPHCSAPLRVREKLYVGRHVDCPECAQSLRIVETRDGMGVERAERRPDVGLPNPARNQSPAPQSPQAAVVTAVPENVGASAAPAALVAAVPATSPCRNGKRKQPLLAVGVAIAIVGIVCGTALYLKSNGGSPAGADGAGDPIVAEGGDVQEDPDERENAVAAPKQIDQPPRSELEQRLSKIGDLLLEFAETEKGFPSGTVPILGIAPENRLSWMAQLADRFDSGSAPDPVWDKPWNAPQNEPFVRRRLSMFQNPAIAELTGADGYPASHFVGVSGVGLDSARLDQRSARAGIFGNDHQTRLEDIRDGAANTLLVLGVRDQLGSWGAGGPATMRSLTREPYINGPDGFGTGAADAMYALMADGRVISISDKIDARIMRRMAAKADGFPLDESEPGEPGDRPSLLAGEPADDDEASGRPDAVDVADKEPPIEPVFAPEASVPAVRKIDLNESLRQPIVRFDQPRSKSLAEVVTAVAEMAGAKIEYDREELGSAGAHLAEPVALRLEQTTVGDILTGLLRPAGLAYRVEGDHLRVVLRPAE
jgi:hypothetical protein